MFISLFSLIFTPEIFPSFSKEFKRLERKENNHLADIFGNTAKIMQKL